MTKIAGYVVTLEQDQRSGDDEDTLNALRMVKGVASVKPIEANMDQQIAESRALLTLQIKFLKFYDSLRAP